MSGDPDAGTAVVRHAGTSQLGAFPSPPGGPLGALEGWSQTCEHWVTPEAAAGPVLCQTRGSPPRSSRRLKKSLKRQTPAPRAACCGRTPVMPRAWHSSPRALHSSTTLDVIKPQGMSKPAVTKLFVQTQGLHIENILKQLLTKPARSWTRTEPSTRPRSGKEAEVHALTVACTELVLADKPCLACYGIKPSCLPFPR